MTIGVKDSVGKKSFSNDQWHFQKLFGVQLKIFWSCDSGQVTLVPSIIYNHNVCFIELYFTVCNLIYLN